MNYGSIEGLSKRISRIGFGVMGYDSGDMSRVCAVFDEYVKLGGNLFDTGFLYGAPREEALGNWMLKRENRESLVILGKGGHTPYCDPDSITTQLAAELERLQTDHLDLYALHRDNLDVPVGEFIDVLDEHVAAGRMTLFGGSNWTIERICEANAYAESTGKRGFSFLNNNIALAKWNEPMWEGCLSASDAVSLNWLSDTQFPNIAWSSQASGYFTDEVQDAGNGDDKFDHIGSVWANAGNAARLERARQLANEMQSHPLQVALAYVLCLPLESYALIGSQSIEEIRSSLGAIDIALSETEVSWLNLEADTR